MKALEERAILAGMIKRLAGTGHFVKILNIHY
jgi:hypothetical protein